METSEKIDSLVASLAAAQLEFPKIGKNKQGYGYKYADLESVIDATKDGLSKNGLAITQVTSENANGEIVLMTLLAHVSGQYIKGSTKLIIDQKKGLGSMQNLGVAITYARRYGLQSILNISADEDTDGVADRNKQQGNHQNNQQKDKDYKSMFISKLKQLTGDNQTYKNYIQAKVKYDHTSKNQLYWKDKLEELLKINKDEMIVACQ